MKQVNLVKTLGWSVLSIVVVVLGLSALATVLLIMNGDAEMHQTLRLFGLALFALDSSKDGFAISYQPGLFILALASGVITFFTAFIVRPQKNLIPKVKKSLN